MNKRKLIIDSIVSERLPVGVGQGVDKLYEEKLNLPQERGIIDHGTAGQFAVSDGKGGIEWKTLVEAEAVMY